MSAARVITADEWARMSWLARQTAAKERNLRIVEHREPRRPALRDRHIARCGKCGAWMVRAADCATCTTEAPQ